MSILEGRGRGRVTIVYDRHAVTVIDRERLAQTHFDKQAGAFFTGGTGASIPTDLVFVSYALGEHAGATNIHVPCAHGADVYASIVDEDQDVVWTIEPARRALDDDGAEITVPSTWRRTPDR